MPRQPRCELYRDSQAGFEGFKTRSFLFREKFFSKTWATGYDFPAVRDRRVKRDEVPDATPSGNQGWLFNTRRAKFADPRLREALNYAFDFEWTNKNIMFGSSPRTRSVFQNSDLMAAGLPSQEETRAARIVARQDPGRASRVPPRGSRRFDNR